MKRIATFALTLTLAFVSCQSQAGGQSERDRSEFRIYYYAPSGLVFDEGHGVKEYNQSLVFMNEYASGRGEWIRYRTLCGLMVSSVTCAKFDLDINTPGSDVFCANLPDYVDESEDGMSEADLAATEDLCEAHKARSIRNIRVSYFKPWGIQE